MKKYFITLLLFTILAGQNIYSQKGYAWKKLGSGINTGSGCINVTKCKFIDSNLYVISNHNGDSSTIYKWNGISWSQYPRIYNAAFNHLYISDIEIFKDELYVCGSINKIKGLQRGGTNALGVIKYNGSKWDSLPSYPVMAKDSMINTWALCKYKNKLYYLVLCPRNRVFSLDTFGTTGHLITNTRTQSSGWPYNVLTVANNKLTIAGYIDSVMSRQKTSGIFYYDGSSFSYPKNNNPRNIVSVLPRNDSQYLVVTAANKIELWEKDSLKKDITPASVFFNSYYITATFYKNLIIIGRDSSSTVHYDMDSSKWFLKNNLTSPQNQPIAVNAGPNKAIAFSCYLFKGIAEMVPGGVAKGKLYWDKDSGCTFNAGDVPLKNFLVEYSDSSGKYYTFSDSNGDYEFTMPAGTYNVTYFLPEVKSSISPCSAVSATVTTNNIVSGIDMAVHPRTDRNLATHFSSYRGFRSRQGFTESYLLTGANYSFKNDSLILKLKYPSKVTFVSSDITPFTNSSNELVYKFYNVGFNEIKSILIKFSTSVNTSKIGDTLKFYASVVNSVADSFISNNYDTLCERVVAAYDPNVKQSFPEGRVSPGLKKIKYVIHFQNTGNDVAYKVTVVDTITQKLGLRHLKVTGTSHPHVYSLRVDGKQALVWEFNDIMLPDSHTNEKASHGFITFEADINGVIAVGDSITNKAYIYFDYQKPVITNTASVVIVNPTVDIKKVHSVSGSELQVYPNPSSAVVNIQTQSRYNDFNVSMYDLMGKQTASVKIIDNIATFNVANLPKGIYFVKIEGTEISGKLIVE